MIKARALVTGLVLAAAGAWGVVQLREFAPALRTNKARWLVNQEKWSEAGRELEATRRRHPDYERANRLLAYVNLNLGKHTEAAALIARMSPGGEQSFLQGALAYLQGDDEKARDFLRKALGAPDELEPWMRQVAQLAQGDLPPGGVAGLRNPDPDRAEGAAPLEKILVHSYAGRELFEQQQFPASSSHFEQAWQAGDRNTRTMALGALADALHDHFASAARYADSATSRSAFLELFLREAEDLKSEVTDVVASTVQGAREAGVLRSRIRRAVLWAKMTAADAGMHNREELVREAELLRDLEGNDPVNALVVGEVLERAGELAKAYQTYQNAYKSTPAYPLLIRMRDLAGDQDHLRPQEAEFLRDRHVVGYVPADSMTTTGTEPRRNGIAFLTGGVAEAEFSVPEDGDYEIALVARSDRAWGLGARAALFIDGTEVGDIYIAREGWDLYSRREGLARGAHRLQIRYVNDRDRILSPDQDRNMYLQGVLVTRAGGQ